MGFELLEQQFNLPAATIETHDLFGRPVLSRQVGHPQAEAFLLGKPAPDQAIVVRPRLDVHVQHLIPAGSSRDVFDGLICQHYDLPAIITISRDDLGIEILTASHLLVAIGLIQLCKIAPIDIARIGQQQGIAHRLGGRQLLALVLTSYSIQYTKLYDGGA